MGLKSFSQLSTPNYQSYLKHPKGPSFRGAMDREDRSAWSRLGWKDLGIEKGVPLYAAACVGGKKLSGVKFFLRVPFLLFTIPGHRLLCLPGAIWTLRTWWYSFSHILFSLDILPWKYAGTKPEAGKEHVPLSCHPKNTPSPKRRQRRYKCIMN